MSRLSMATPAVRPKLLGRVMISGPSGAGKTYSALTIARDLVNGDMSKVTVIDTERESALTYADEFGKFNHLPWDPPYNPTELGETILEAGLQHPGGVVIVDSLTHFWSKEGGTMTIADGKFGGWNVARPAQEQMVNGILGSKAHTIVCVRSKVSYAQEDDPNRPGRTKIVRLGMAPQQDATLDYEMNVALELDLEHNLYVSKSRAKDIPVNRQYVPGRVADFAADYMNWLEGGTELDALSVEALKTRIASTGAAVQAELKSKWVERHFPKIDLLSPPQILRVSSIIDQIEADLSKAPVSADGSVDEYLVTDS